MDLGHPAFAWVWALVGLLALCCLCCAFCIFCIFARRRKRRKEKDEYPSTATLQFDDIDSLPPRYSGHAETAVDLDALADVGSGMPRPPSKRLSSLLRGRSRGGSSMGDFGKIGTSDMLGEESVELALPRRVLPTNSCDDHGICSSTSTEDITAAMPSFGGADSELVLPRRVLATGSTVARRSQAESSEDVDPASGAM